MQGHLITNTVKPFQLTVPCRVCSIVPASYKLFPSPLNARDEVQGLS